MEREPGEEIQRAIHGVPEGRTPLVITHRLSQIRWADKVLVLRQGELIDQGTHDELLGRCETYRRIFAHYGPAQQENSKAGVQKTQNVEPPLTFLKTRIDS